MLHTFPRIYAIKESNQGCAVQTNFTDDSDHDYILDEIECGDCIESKRRKKW